MGYYFLSEPSRCLPAKKIAAKYDTMYTLTDSGISQIMSEIKGNQKEYLKIEVAPLRRYFPPGTTAKQMQTTMIRAMEFYRQHTQNRADKPKEREER